VIVFVTFPDGTMRAKRPSGPYEGDDISLIFPGTLTPKKKAKHNCRSIKDWRTKTSDSKGQFFGRPFFLSPFYEYSLTPWVVAKYVDELKSRKKSILRSLNDKNVKKFTVNIHNSLKGSH